MMAATVCLKKSYLLLRNLTKSAGYAVTNKCYSQYPAFYVEPEYDKKKLKEMKLTGELAALESVPIKAARNEGTCSVFNDETINKFANYVMRMGRKALARELIEDTFENIKRLQLKKYYNETDPEARSKIETNPRVIFHQAVRNCSPILQLSPVIRGGSTYQVPVPVTDKRAQFLSMNWLIKVAQEASSETPFSRHLAYELLDAYNNVGKVIKKKTDLHRQCEANRAYAHYRWA